MSEEDDKRKLKFFTTLIFIPVLIFTGEIISEIDKYPTQSWDNFEIGLTEDNILLARSPILYEENNKIDLIIKDLIECESNGNPKAIGDNGQSFSILQFQKLTFDNFCIKKYKLADNINQIWDVEIQKECARKMLQDKLGFHWTCYKKIKK